MQDESFQYGNRYRLDPEVVNLVLALNSFPGIHTTESCCGHRQHRFWICFEARDLGSLPPLLYWFRHVHEEHDYHSWSVEAHTNKDQDIVLFRLTGPSGEEGYAQANELAKLILHRNQPSFPRWIYLIWQHLQERESE